MYKLILVHITVQYVLCQPVTRVDPLVETNLGLIRGIQSDDGRYSKFLGIPYAVVDEEQPFAPSVPHGGFNESFNAFDDSTMCPQMGFDGSIRGSLQCLNLNIYVPSTANRNNQLPVMVHIHGGAFIYGSGSSTGTPEYLVEKDVIFVSINYRLGPYGFFCTNSPKAPGNVGLKDQLNALRWVRANIHSFGGNSNKITVFGESAGGMSINLHLLSPHEQLFEGAIIESGSANSPLIVGKVDNDLPLRTAARLGYVTENVDDALNFLSRTEIDLVLAAVNSFLEMSFLSQDILTKPCVEIEQDGIERFITVHPNNARPEKVRDISVMTGFTTQEMMFMYGFRSEEYFNNFDFAELLSFSLKPEAIDDMADIVKHFYIGDSDPSLDLVNEITSYASDFVFNYPTESAVQKMLDVGAKAVYQYVFSYDGNISYMQTTLDIEGVNHASELLYLLNTSYVDRTEHEEMIERATTLWTNFAKYGDPTPETTDLLPVKWEPVSQDYLHYLNINRDLTLESRPFHDRMIFWELFYRVNERHTLWYDGEE